MLWKGCPKITIPVFLSFFLCIFFTSSGFCSDSRLFQENHSLAKKTEQIVSGSWMKHIAPVITPGEQSECLNEYSEATSRFYREIRRKEENERTSFTQRVRNRVFNHVSLWDCGEYIQTHPYMPSFPPGLQLTRFLEFLRSVNYSGWPVSEYEIYFGNSPEDSASLVSYLNKEKYGSPAEDSLRYRIGTGGKFGAPPGKQFYPRFSMGMLLPANENSRRIFNALSALRFRLFYKQEVEEEKLTPGELSFISEWNEMINKLLKVSGGDTTGKKTESPTYK